MRTRYKLKELYGTFPSGEPRAVNMLDVAHNAASTNYIIINVQKFDYFALAVVLDAADRVGLSVDLFIPYIAGARQDRVMNVGESFTANVMAKMIKHLYKDYKCIKNITSFEPHSDVLPALLDEVVDFGTIGDSIIRDRVIKEREGKVYIIAPDAGATKRTLEIKKRADKLIEGDLEIEFAQGFKIRNTQDGSLSGFGVDVEDFGGNPVYIFDDVNCKGGTFIGLSKLLKERNAGKVTLFTSHADCQDGVDNVTNNEFIDRYLTTDSTHDWQGNDKFELVQIIFTDEPKQ